MTSTKDYLLAIRAKIEAGWCQNAPALNNDGDEVHIDDPTATRVCLVTAIYQTVPEADLARVYAPIMQSCNVVKDFKLVDWNNDPQRTKDQVLKMLDKALQNVG